MGPESDIMLVRVVRHQDGRFGGPNPTDQAAVVLHVPARRMSAIRYATQLVRWLKPWTLDQVKGKKQGKE